MGVGVALGGWANEGAAPTRPAKTRTISRIASRRYMGFVLREICRRVRRERYGSWSLEPAGTVPASSPGPCLDVQLDQWAPVKDTFTSTVTSLLGIANLQSLPSLLHETGSTDL